MCYITLDGSQNRNANQNLIHSHVYKEMVSVRSISFKVDNDFDIDWRRVVCINDYVDYRTNKVTNIKVINNHNVVILTNYYLFFHFNNGNF